MLLNDHCNCPSLKAAMTGPVATPFDTLPYDILSKAFSYLTQVEVLEAMAVCRTWYEHLPCYTTHLWRSVTISAKEGGLINRRKAQCLGSHVHTVIASFYKGNSIFPKDMEEIVKLTEGSVRAAVFCFCSSFQSIGFYSGLAILGKHLTRLAFSNHLGNNLDFFDIMSACPHLTYFEMQRPGVLVTRNIPPFYITFPKLTDLLLDGTPCLDFDLEAILDRCPGLRFLGFTQRKWVPGDIASLTRHCNRLESLYFVDTEITFAKLRRKSLLNHQQEEQQDNMDYCLRELSIQPVERHGALSVSALVDRHLGTLKHLRLLNCFYSHLGSGTIAYSLTQLVLSNVEARSHDLANLFSHCPNIVDLTFAQHISTFTPDLIDALSTNLNRLERLDFDLLYNQPIHRPIPRRVAQGLLRLFSGIQHNPVMRLKKLFVVNKKIPINDSVLYSIACLDTLEVLAVSSAFCTDAGLAAFADRLAQRRRPDVPYSVTSTFSHNQSICNSSSSSKRSHRLSHITLYHVDALFSPNVMSAFGSIDGLEDFCLTACTHVTSDGLHALLSKTSGMTKLRLVRCHIIDAVDWISVARLLVDAVYFDSMGVQF
ncbi:hypothetical protein BX666DRAFT_1967575 [Dichotomocladium elegans]|nr:hypothetical protein BX666DRAFT_1967575 [Dichotomocladium elegans]